MRADFSVYPMFLCNIKRGCHALAVVYSVVQREEGFTVGQFPSDLGTGREQQGKIAVWHFLSRVKRRRCLQEAVLLV